MLVRCYVPASVLHPPSSLHHRWQLLLGTLFMRVILVIHSIHDSLLSGMTAKGVSLTRSWENPPCL